VSAYGQFCPVSKAMELLDERWTMLVVRELMLGSRHFNELRRGVPRMSPALLSKRLRTLTRAGVVERRDDGPRVTYVLTEAGQELRPIVEALGRWGVRWIPELGDEDLDPHLLLWDMHRSVDLRAVPEGRTVLRFSFADVPAPARNWWMLITPDGVDLCDFDPGYPEYASVEGDLRILSMVWRGDLGWPEALRSGRLAVNGQRRAGGNVPRWLGQSSFADVPRPAATGSRPSGRPA
jgi:DNA-binding HxlR family transcriptional regulator